MPRYIEDENGYVTFPNTPLSKAGVFPYLGREISPDLDPNKIYNVYRPESELKNEKTIESFRLSPWFGRHQMAGDEFTAAEDIGVQGTTGQDVAYVDGVGLVATVKVFGSMLKAAIKSGLKELSCGFRCTWEIISGTTPDGIKYDVIQRNIRGNHLASVDEGRMGPQFAVAMDRACLALDQLTTQKGDNMSIEELMATVREAQPAKEELAKLYAEIGSMLGEGGEPEPEEAVEMDADPAPEDEPAPEEEVMDECDKPAMDASVKAALDAMTKTVKSLSAKVDAMSSTAMDAAKAAKAKEQDDAKTQLLADLEPVAGKIDGTGLDINGVAKKAADILGIACDSSSALASVRGYLHAQTGQKTTVDKGTAKDSKPAEAVTKLLDEAGL